MGKMAERLELRVNGEVMQVAPGMTLARLVAQLGLDLRKVAVERNLEIVPRSAYDRVALAPDDQLEIVHFIGGG